MCMCVCACHLLVGYCYCGLYPFSGLSGATFLFCEHHSLDIPCYYRLYFFLDLVSVAVCLYLQMVSGTTSLSIQGL